jgi:hypothetical protein
VGEITLINKTRIFISSAYENDLKTPRKIIKNHLENCGHEVPIFEDGDFGTWEKDTLKQCLDIVGSSDVFVLLINRQSGATSRLMDGNVTPTYLEYKAAINQNKHILVFVSPIVKQNFNILKREFDRLYKSYHDQYHRLPSSPFDPLKGWVETNLAIEGTFKDLLEVADPFVWAFLSDIYRNRNWVYDYDVAKSEEHAKNISAMLSTTLRSVVGLVSEREQIDELKSHTSYLLAYADYTLMLMNERNQIVYNGVQTWSNFLDIGIQFLKRNIEFIQARETNPMIVNGTSGCFAASLYTFDKESKKLLNLVGSTGQIDPDEFYKLEEENIFVVNSYNQQERLITFREDKQTLYVTEPINDTVLCMHFKVSIHWTEEQVKAYEEEIKYAIIEQHEYFYEYLIGMIGG